MKVIELHVDGASESNGGNAGAGIILKYNGVAKKWGIPLGQATNMRAELMAVIEGLKLVKEPCHIKLYSDNQVTIKIIQGEYKASSNLDLWGMYHEVAKGHEIIAEWNRRDSTQENKECNDLAQRAARMQKRIIA